MLGIKNIKLSAVEEQYELIKYPQDHIRLPLVYFLWLVLLSHNSPFEGDEEHQPGEI